MKHILLTLLSLFILSQSNAQEYFTVTDARDGQVYKAVEFTIPLEGGISIKRSWLLQNANYETEEGSTCYREEPAYCEKFGRLYTYEAALKACPEGWRIPTRKDWLTLFTVFGGAFKAGKVLVRTDTTSLNILWGGFRYHGEHFNNVGFEGNYWDSKEEGDSPDGIIIFTRGSEMVLFDEAGKKYMNSCRCIKAH